MAAFCGCLKQLYFWEQIFSQPLRGHLQKWWIKRWSWLVRWLQKWHIRKKQFSKCRQFRCTYWSKSLFDAEVSRCADWCSFKLTGLIFSRTHKGPPHSTNLLRSFCLQTESAQPSRWGSWWTIYRNIKTKCKPLEPPFTEYVKTRFVCCSPFKTKERLPQRLASILCRQRVIWGGCILQPQVIAW